MDNLTAQIALVTALVVLELLRRLRGTTMNATEKKSALLTIPEAALRVGIKENHLRRLFERDLLPAVEIVAGRRLIPESILPEIKKAASKAGYLAADT